MCLACGLQGRLRSHQRPDRVRACSQRRLSGEALWNPRCLLARAPARTPAAHQVPETQPRRVLPQASRPLRPCFSTRKLRCYWLAAAPVLI